MAASSVGVVHNRVNARHLRIVQVKRKGYAKVIGKTG